MKLLSIDLPEKTVLLDHALVGEEFLEIWADRLGVGRPGAPQVDQQHADARRASPAAALGELDAGVAAGGAAVSLMAPTWRIVVVIASEAKQSRPCIRVEIASSPFGLSQ